MIPTYVNSFLTIFGTMYTRVEKLESELLRPIICSCILDHFHTQTDLDLLLDVW